MAYYVWSDSVSFNLLKRPIRLVSTTLLMLCLATSIQSSAVLSMKWYSNRSHQLPTDNTLLLDDPRSAIDCLAECLETLNTSCRSFGYKDSGTKKCIISSDLVVNVETSVDISPLSDRYTLYSQGTCPTGEYNFNPMTRRCVGLHKINLNWQDSKDFCESRGEYILALSSAEDAMQVVNIMQNYRWRRPWIGAYRESGVWRWHGRLEGPIDYTLSDFWTDAPDEGHSCLILENAVNSTKMFDDFSCAEEKFVFCETNLIY